MFQGVTVVEDYLNIAVIFQVVAVEENCVNFDVIFHQHYLMLCGWHMLR